MTVKFKIEIKDIIKYSSTAFWYTFVSVAETDFSIEVDEETPPAKARQLLPCTHPRSTTARVARVTFSPSMDNQGFEDEDQQEQQQEQEQQERERERLQLLNPGDDEERGSSSGAGSSGKGYNTFGDDGQGKISRIM